MKKTIKQWFESVADPKLRKELMDAMDKHNCNNKVGSLSSAIRCSFSWSSTKQGVRYWSKIANDANKGKIKLLPDNPKVKTYHNTTQLRGEELQTAKEKAEFQYKSIKKFFTKRKGKYTSDQILETLILEKVFDKNTLLTSVRRAVSDLKREGFIECVGKVLGKRGSKVMVYKKA